MSWCLKLYLVLLCVAFSEHALSVTGNSGVEAAAEWQVSPTQGQSFYGPIIVGY